MEEYNQFYERFAEKTDTELKKIINPQSGYPKLAVEAARDILCYERKVCDPDDLDNLFDKNKIIINNVEIDFHELLKKHGSDNVGAARELRAATGVTLKEAMKLLNSYAKGIPIYNEKGEKTKDLALGESKALNFIQLCGILALMLTIYPVGVYLLWKNDKFDKVLKVIETISCLMLWVMLITVSVNKISHITETDAEAVAQVEDERPDILETGSEGNSYQVSEELFEHGETIAYNIRKEISLVPKPISKELSSETEVESDETKEEQTDSSEEIGDLEMSNETEGGQEVPDEEVDESEDVSESKEISELEISGENVIDITVRDMKESYDYVTDVSISVDESKEQINIAVQVPALTDIETAKMAGEDIARYLAFNASSANSYYKSPGSDDIGGIYEKYNLLIYIDDGNHLFDMYGAKVTTANRITWN